MRGAILRHPAHSALVRFQAADVRVGTGLDCVRGGGVGSMLAARRLVCFSTPALSRPLLPCYVLA